MKKDLNQLQREMAALDNDRELDRAMTEIMTLEKEIARLEVKRNEWSEKKRQREAAIVAGKHDLERQIEEAKAEQNAAAK